MPIDQTQLESDLRDFPGQPWNISLLQTDEQTGTGPSVPEVLTLRRLTLRPAKSGFDLKWTIESDIVNPPDHSDQIIRLEMAVAHLEHELEQMHSVLLSVQAELKGTRDQMAKLERRITISTEMGHEQDIPNEKPPHY